MRSCQITYKMTSLVFPPFPVTGLFTFIISFISTWAGIFDSEWYIEWNLVFLISTEHLESCNTRPWQIQFCLVNLGKKYENFTLILLRHNKVMTASLADVHTPHLINGCTGSPADALTQKKFTSFMEFHWSKVCCYVNLKKRQFCAFMSINNTLGLPHSPNADFKTISCMHFIKPYIIWLLLSDFFLL